MRLVVFRSDYFRDLDTVATPEVAAADVPDVVLRDPITLHVGQQPDALPQALQAIAFPAAMHAAPADPVAEWRDTVDRIMRERGVTKQHAVLHVMEHFPMIHERYVLAHNGKC